MCYNASIKEKDMTEKFNEAIVFASERHARQKRKVAPFPYIVHIYEVMQILRENGADEDTLIGGILHDTVEDTGTSLAEIEGLFGKKVATLVSYVSEIKSLPYVERKEEHAKRLANGPIEAKMIKCADCLSNLRSLYFDLKYMGREIWNNFNSTKDNIAQHYYHSIKIFSPLKHTQMYKELTKYFRQVFLEKRTLLTTSMIKAKMILVI